jgi:hypothetical protein
VTTLPSSPTSRSPSSASFGASPGQTEITDRAKIGRRGSGTARSQPGTDVMIFF